MPLLLKLKDIRKKFGKVIALDGVSLGVEKGEVVGLVGDNGAGKSTLIKILMGVLSADTGEIYFKGKKLERHTPAKARKLGIEAVYQEQALALKQPLWRNVFLGREATSHLGFLRMGYQKRKTDELMKKKMRFSGNITHDSRAQDLSGGERQGLAIVRSLFFESSLVVLDEPTTALSITEVDKVLDFVRMIKSKEKSCIFITHTIYNVYSVADRLVILDRGKKVEDIRKEGVSMEKLVHKLRRFARKA